MESWTKQEVDLTLEMTRNGYKFVDETGENIIAIDWDYWAKLTNITPEQGARLANYINPRTWPGGEYNLGMMPQDLLDDIADLTQLLGSKRDKWTLSDLVTELGEVAPWGMIESIKSKTVNQSGGVYAERDEDFIAWIQNDKPELDAMKKDEIREALIQRNRGLWCSGFYDWWKQQNIYKGKPGRKRNRAKA